MGVTFRSPHPVYNVDDGAQSCISFVSHLWLVVVVGTRRLILCGALLLYLEFELDSCVCVCVCDIIRLQSVNVTTLYRAQVAHPTTTTVYNYSFIIYVI